MKLYTFRIEWDNGDVEFLIGSTLVDALKRAGYKVWALVSLMKAIKKVTRLIQP